MVTVALIGASTGFGLTLLRTFIQYNNNKHKIVLLSRSEKPEVAAQGIDVRPVDYTNHEQLVRALSGVHTVLSLIGGSLEGVRDSQLNVLAAAKEAGVKRFAPSEYAGSGYEGVDLYAPKAEVWEAALKSGLEVTRFNSGMFMSALATGTPKPVTAVGKREGAKTGEEEALSGLRPWNYVVNMIGGTADLAGDGTTPICWTEMRDISMFVLRALDLEKWPLDLGMRGDVKSFKEVVEICEKVQGRTWLKKNNRLEDLEDTGKHTKRFYNQTRVALAKGWGMVGDELNKAFPDVKTTTCEEFVERWWSGVELGEPSWGEDRSFRD